MRVLFVGSGNKTNGEPSILINNQAISLEKKGCTIDFYIIKGKGIWGYLKNIPALRKKIKAGNYNIVHAHYSLSGLLMSLSSLFLNKSKKIVSLMGSDTQVSGMKRTTIRIFYNFFWDATIVKTKKMQEEFKLGKAYVIPNGVNLTGISSNEKSQNNTVLFAADPSRKSKNFPLAKAALEYLEDKKQKDIPLKIIYNVPYQEIINEIHSSGCVLVTSLWEGSPNIIKEAMACNRPIVSTNVGDVNWLLQDVSGCYIVNSTAEDVGEGISAALQFSNDHGETNGRNKIIKLGLDSESVADKIITLYNN